MTSPVEIIEAHMLVGASVDVPLCACGAEWEPAHVAAALEEARREAYEITEEWGVERDVVRGGRRFATAKPSREQAVAVAKTLEDWGMNPALVRREVLTGPWQPSASEEG